ncbi:MAG: response regulator [Planctomycetes bacterium]|nr:response regulator [Planctomycetota bacterium]
MAADPSPPVGDSTTKRRKREAEAKAGGPAEPPPFDALGIGRGDTGRRKRETSKMSRPTTLPVPETPVFIPSSDIEAPSPPPPPTAGAKRRILVVDNSRQIRHIIVFELQREGYDCLDAASGAEALVALGTSKVDLVLLDVMMPEIDGFTVLSKIRANEHMKHIPVIMVTARNQREDIVNAIKSGANDYMVKPFQKRILLAKVRKCLGEPEPPPK